ncbi:MAG: hypothetical protein ACRBN8_12615 [Nannocystales bacterium]
MRRTLQTILVVLAWTSGCGEPSSDAESLAGEGGGKQDGTDAEGAYVFVAKERFTLRKDHAGAPLLATIWGRIDEYNEDAPYIDRHAYNDADDASGLPWLGHVVVQYKMLWNAWAPSLEAMGLDTCDEFGLTDDEIFTPDGIDWEAFEPEQCFAQRVLWQDPEEQEREFYRRVIAISVPDYLTVDITRGAGFPNGRVLHEQINSMMFAMAFLDHGGRCTTATTGDGAGQPTQECDLYTLWNRDDFLKPYNEAPLAGATELGEPAKAFPFMPKAHRVP